MLSFNFTCPSCPKVDFSLKKQHSGKDVSSSIKCGSTADLDAVSCHMLCSNQLTKAAVVVRVMSVDCGGFHIGKCAESA